MTQVEEAAPRLLADRGVSKEVDLPDEIIALYGINEHINTGEEDRENQPTTQSKETYTRQSTLTSEGWVPPVSHADLMLMRTTSSDDLNSIDSFRNVTTSVRRVVIDPRELDKEVGEERIENETQYKPVCIYGDWDPSKIIYYIPDVNVEKKEKYIKSCLKRVQQTSGRMRRSEARKIAIDYWGVAESEWNEMSI